MLRIIVNESFGFLRNLLSHYFIWIALALYGFYWVLAAFLPAALLMEISSTLVLAGSAIVFLTWLPALVAGLAAGGATGAWQLPIAIAISFFGLTAKFMWAMVWRMNNEPSWMVANHFIGQADWILFLASFLYVLSPGNTDGKVPVRNWYALAAIFIAGLLLVGYVIAVLTT